MQTTEESTRTADALAEDVIQWFWSFGSQRAQAYAISPQWLRSVYIERDTLRAVSHSRLNAKFSVGLWGPSQSGKSTLISQFVDFGSDLSGRGGYLHWDQPTLFSSRADLPDGVTVFNPHNVGADASGCISRFTMRQDSEVQFVDAPVELRWLSSGQIMHAISSGYLSECQCDRDWQPERLEQLLDKLPAAKSASPNQAAFELLHEVLDVIGLLVEANDERFGKLNLNDAWSSLSSRIVDTVALNSDRKRVLEFAAEVLWGNEPLLTRLYESLMSVRSKLPESKLFCSMEVAALLVNIESFKIYLNDSGGIEPRGATRIREAIKNLRIEKRGDSSVIVVKTSGTKLLANDADYGFFQGLVRELVIPLRASRAKGRANEGDSFHKFMKQSELVDFPGVPRRDKNAAATMMNLQEVTEANDPRLLTEVLKRGKVASLVSGYSRSLGLDAFLILARAGDFVPKVEQLHRGLSAWWSYVDPTYDVYKPQGRRSPLPLFFNMTFFANIVDKIVDGAVQTGLHPLNEMVRQLEPFVDPNTCTLLTTTYPQFKEGKIHASLSNAKKAVQSILTDPTFGSRCTNAITRQSLDEMVSKPDGGVGYLFEVIQASIAQGDRARLIAARQRDSLATLIAQLEEQIPRAGNGQHLKDVETFKAAISRTLKEKKGDKLVRDPAAWVGYRLRKFFDVAPECLDPLPASGVHNNYEQYLQTQLKQWSESKLKYNGLGDLGLRDVGLRTRILEMLVQRVNVRETGKWMKENIPNRPVRDDAYELRRIVALVLQDRITSLTQSDKAHPSLEGSNGVVAYIRKWSEIEEADEGQGDVKHSPHFSSVIAPLAKLLEQLATGAQIQRPPQSGDAEAQAIFEKLVSVRA